MLQYIMQLYCYCLNNSYWQCNSDVQYYTVCTEIGEMLKSVLETFRASLLPDPAVQTKDPPGGGMPETGANEPPSSTWAAHQVPVL